MTVINGSTAVNELQADRSTRMCTHIAYPQPDTHAILSFDNPHLHVNECFFGAKMRCSAGVSCSFMWPPWSECSHIFIFYVIKITEFISWKYNRAITCNSWIHPACRHNALLSASRSWEKTFFFTCFAHYVSIYQCTRISIFMWLLSSKITVI